jgi:hypothetical protein
MTAPRDPGVQVIVVRTQDAQQVRARPPTGPQAPEFGAWPEKTRRSCDAERAFKNGTAPRIEPGAVFVKFPRGF